MHCCPRLVAALRLPLTLLLGFVLVLVLDALMLLAADAIPTASFTMDSFWSALGGRAHRVRRRRRARRALRHERRRHLHVPGDPADRPPLGRAQIDTDAPGIVFLEIDGLALPVLQRAMRDGSAPTMARWLVGRLIPAGGMGDRPLVADGCVPGRILLGSNEDIPAFRWVEKETATLMTRAPAPEDCAEIERRLRIRAGVAARRRSEPRQPPFGRGRPHDPHRQPDGRREARPTPATGRSSPTASTSCARSCCSAGR